MKYYWRHLILTHGAHRSIEATVAVNSCEAQRSAQRQKVYRLGTCLCQRRDDVNHFSPQTFVKIARGQESLQPTLITTDSN